MKRIYVKGVFDILHYGHVRFLMLARGLGDHLTVGVTPDERATRLKRPPMFPEDIRAEVVSALRCVDEVITTGPQQIGLDHMRAGNYAIYAFGSANEEERQFRLRDCVELPPGMIVEIPYTFGVSTTAIGQAGSRG